MPGSKTSGVTQQLKEIFISKTTTKPTDSTRINEGISAKQIRLIDSNGEMVGVVTVAEGLALAYEQELDLVEISPNADPPVCRIMDYGKFKYEKQKQAHKAKMKQKVVELKEIKLGPNIGENDLQVKLRNARKFIAEGNKVKFTLRFRGREITHREIGVNLLNRIKEEMQEVAKVEQEPKLEGKLMMMVLGPK